MPLEHKDRISDTSNTTGTGTLTLTGTAPAGRRSFASGHTTGATVRYAIESGDKTQWEVGEGTWTTSGATLTRVTVFASSNDGSLVNFTATPLTVMSTMTAKDAYGQGSGYARYLAAAMEPDAIEAVQKNAFSYAVSSSETKLLIASMATRLGASGRMEQRNPQNFFPLRNVTLTGLGTGSAAIIVDPSLVSYGNAWETYYGRKEYLADAYVKNLAFTAVSQKLPFLPGAYGAIITQYTCFDLAWLALRPLGGSSIGINLWDEISDSATQRIGGSLAMPIHKCCAGEIHSSATGSSPSGSVSYVLLPSTWSAIADTNTYSFRDDFMGASLDTGVWTRSQSTSGNMEIDPQYQWLKAVGNSTWGANGIRRTSTESRVNGKKLLVDFYIPQTITNGLGMVGWNTGAGNNYSDFAHAVNFANANVINIYENGTARGAVGSGYTVGAIYRVQITLNSSGAALYEIQGGPEYPKIGGASWTNITPGTTSSASNTLTPGATMFANTSYISDFRVI